MNYLKRLCAYDTSSAIIEGKMLNIIYSSTYRSALIFIVAFVMFLNSIIIDSEVLKNVTLMICILLAIVAIYLSIFSKYKIAVYPLIAIILFEPFFKVLLTELGEAFGLYVVAICCFFLFLKKREFSWLGLAAILVGMSSYFRVVIDHLIISGAPIAEILSQSIYKWEIHRGTFYVSGGLLLFFMKGWNPRHKEIMKIMKYGAFIFLIFVISSIVYTSLYGFDEFQTLRLDSVGDQGSNTFAVIATMAVLSFFFLCVYKKLKIEYILGIIVCVGALWFSKSRAQILVFIVFIPLLIPFLYKRKWVAMRSFVLIIFVILLIISIILLSEPTQKFLLEFLDIYDRDITTASNRTIYWKYILDNIFGHFFWGQSFHQYVELLKSNPEVPIHMQEVVVTPHNPFLNVLAFNGLYVAIIFIIAHFGLLYKNTLMWNDAGRRAKILILTSTVLIFTQQSIDIWYYYYFLYLALGEVIVSNCRSIKSTRKNRSRKISFHKKNRLKCHLKHN